MKIFKTHSTGFCFLLITCWIYFLELFSAELFSLSVPTSSILLLFKDSIKAKSFTELSRLRAFKLTMEADPANVSSNSSSIDMTFVNHAEIAWQEMRSKWIGDPSKRTSQMPLEPVISFNATYEDLLVPNTPFPKPIPLAEMVDFLVDYWHGDGLFE